MMCLCSAAILYWFVSTSVTVSLGNVEPTLIYGIKGRSIPLKFPASFSSLTQPNFVLKREGGDILVKNCNVGPKFSRKVKCFSGNFSIKFSHLSEDDGGIYEVYDSQDWKDNHLASYRVVILEPLLKPTIQTSVKGSHGNTPGQNCSFVVNCSSAPYWKSYNCDLEQCTMLGSSPSDMVNITLKNDIGAIECTVNNPVSSKTASHRLDETCIEDSIEKTEQSLHLKQNVTIIAITSAAVLLLVCVILIAFKRHAVKSKKAPQKVDIPTVIVTGSDGDKSGGQEATSIYSVINKSARCSNDAKPTQISHTNTNETSRSTSAEAQHRSPRQQKTRGKQCPSEDNSSMTIYTTATKPLEKHSPPAENKDTTIYATATKPLEEQRPLRDTESTIYDAPTSKPRQISSVSPDQATNTTQASAEKADTLYYTLGHMGSGL